jgi:hypothetical protein
VRLRFAALCLLALAFPLIASAAAPLTVVFRATTHAPKVNARWPWSITATSRGKPVAGTVTAQVVDPVGGIHAVEFGGVKSKFVTNVKFRGRFSDFVIYPPISRGVGVTFRATVKTALGKRVVNYPVTAR